MHGIKPKTLQAFQIHWQIISIEKDSLRSKFLQNKHISDYLAYRGQISGINMVVNSQINTLVS